ncbi:cytochrome P450 [Mycobacteroides immunogenum]|uniref:Cytochrome n=1 Tax=Mycobacteroides immunogenum TaxID=83262 RepID=A0A7V8LJS1_9MYCO|nr:cytochrome P450 [Mycobacteroides immunogenum]AMT72305.1 cytochrome P450 [Mycobacteroides immunogenum]ANO05445.1 cytochrome [Mycobacteroides immunogenum]KIU37566.1 cytochrome P450 [Mycobacteroides immunogenum]KPG02984.1 cytochrome [Mycobacteroides immunogenum]KPG03060.1 cytochrome [Mycobacteroides immunogenum]
MTTVDIVNPSTYVPGFPYREVAELRRSGPVVWVEDSESNSASGAGFWYVMGHTEVVGVGRHPEVFSSYEGGTWLRDMSPEELVIVRQAMLNIDPPMHTQMRKIINKAFTPRVVASMAESIEVHATNLVNALGDGGEVDWVTAVSAEMPLLVLADILGVSAADRSLLFDWTNRMIAFDDPDAPNRRHNMAAFFELFAYARNKTQEKRAHPGTDVWSLVVNAEVDGEYLTDDQLDRFFQLLVIAGNETTRNMLSGAVLLLSEHPDQFELLRTRPELMPQAVEEILRMFPPIMHFRRTCVQDTTLGGQQIRAGDKVVLSYAAANRDGAVFDNPDTFDITREHNPHVSFGFGTHFCLGGGVARLEGRILLTKLLDRFPKIEVTGPPDRLRSNFVNGITALPVRLSC